MAPSLLFFTTSGHSLICAHKHTSKRSNFVVTCLGKIEYYVAVAKILYKTPKEAVTQQDWDQEGEFPEQFVFSL